MIKENELKKLNVKTPIEEIKYRVGSTWSREGRRYGLMLRYIDARFVMDKLDLIVGSENWSNEYYEIKGNLFCKITIRFLREDGTIDSISKMDCGTESNVEKQKGEASDSFKRCAVHFGLGRDLYSPTNPKDYVVELEHGANHIKIMVMMLEL